LTAPKIGRAKLGRSVSATFFTPCSLDLAYVGRARSVFVTVRFD
jgi:hypothetical protein